MKRLFVVGLLFFSVIGWAEKGGKVDRIQASVKKSCSKELNRRQAIKLVKRVYLVCNTGQLVDVGGGCNIKCLKVKKSSVFGN